MEFGEAIRTCLRKYATFSGRASRSEFWYFQLFVTVTSFVAEILDRPIFSSSEAFNGPLSWIVTVVFIVTGVLAMWVLWLAAGWWFFGPRRRRLSRTSGRRTLHTCGGWNRSRGRPRGFWA